tara:strand:+ start:1851 stop:3194 length:1344 start_codon:yes stop_codon:yes gene_type:complete
MNKINFIKKWEKLKTNQQPIWPDSNHYKEVINKLKTYPKLVTTDEIDSLRSELKQAANGENFIIQGGDCAETFSNFNADTIKNKVKILLQMSAIIQVTTNISTGLIGRIAGQYIKPRSNQQETRKGVTLPSYRGDGVNAIEFNLHSRTPNPSRLITAYHQSASTMNLIRSLIMQGYTDINQIKLWDRIFLDNIQLKTKYNKIVQTIRNMLDFAETTGMIGEEPKSIKNFFTSHEAIVLDYDNAFIYQDQNNKNYCCSSHMLWIGDRTRNIKDAHIQFASLIENPIGIKIGPTVNIDEIVQICKKINPYNYDDKLIFIIRLGYDSIAKFLPALIKKIQSEDLNVLWFCDPMHGNTITAKNGYKTRNFDTIINELKLFFDIHHRFNSIPAGVHLEMTGDNVTECLGGLKNIQDKDLDLRYETTCDPRLNNEQSLEIAFLIAALLKHKGE